MLLRVDELDMSPNKERWNGLEHCLLWGQCVIMPGSPLNESSRQIVLHQIAAIEAVIKGISKNRINSNEEINGRETENFIIVEEHVKKE